jgi:hypothetical protein
MGSGKIQLPSVREALRLHGQARGELAMTRHVVFFTPFDHRSVSFLRRTPVRTVKCPAVEAVCSISLLSPRLIS